MLEHLRRRVLAFTHFTWFVADTDHICKRATIMTYALRLIQWIVRDSGCDEGAVVIVTGAVTVEADFPRCGNHVVRRVSVGKGRATY